VVDHVGLAVLQRDQIDRAGGTRLYQMTAARIVELLNEGGFGMRKSVPSPDEEDDPNWLARFQLYVEASDEFASLTESTWHELGRWHDLPSPSEN